MLAQKKLKVGHGGTLDPMASGVLVIGLGTGCKALSTFLSGSKSYTATAKFGKSFDTLDSTGVLVEEKDLPSDLTMESYQKLLDQRFTGDIMQRPPAFSAVHVNGVRAYDLARKRQEDADGSAPIELPERKIRIESIHVTEWNLPDYKIEVVCGGGTYIRSLIADSAIAAGTVAAMYGLERTKQGPFDLASCIQVDECSDLDRITSVLQHK